MRSAYPAAVVAAVVSLLLAGCGGGSTPDAAASGSSASPASSAPTATATSTAPTPVTKAEFLVKFKTEPDTADLSSEQLDCLADGYLKYVDPVELRQYVDGEIAEDDLSDPADAEAAKQAMLACVAG